MASWDFGMLEAVRPRCFTLLWLLRFSAGTCRKKEEKMNCMLVSDNGDWQERARHITQHDHGFTQRFANLFERKKQSEYESGVFDPDFLQFAHSHGFLAENAAAYDLNDSNRTGYLSDLSSIPRSLGRLPQPPRQQKTS